MPTRHIWHCVPVTVLLYNDPLLYGFNVPIEWLAGFCGQVILVDDCSTDVDLKQALTNYVRLLPKVRLLRHGKRKGLMVSRMDGARATSSPVLFFLDAHAEVNTGWLEPLLAELQRDPKQVLQPFVDGIDAMSLAYQPPGVFHKGSFSWDLR